MTDELDQALDTLAADTATPGLRLMAASVARYEVEMLRGEVDRAWRVAGGGRCQCGQVLTLTEDGRLAEHEDDGVVCEWSGTRDHEPPAATCTVLDADDRRELEQLRAMRDRARRLIGEGTYATAYYTTIMHILGERP